VLGYAAWASFLLSSLAALIAASRDLWPLLVLLLTVALASLVVLVRTSIRLAVVPRAEAPVVRSLLFATICLAGAVFAAAVIYSNGTGAGDHSTRQLWASVALYLLTAVGAVTGFFTAIWVIAARQASRSPQS
jgi:hypothetical protein